MSVPFIKNHQFNAIKRNADALQRAYNTVADSKVIEAVKYTAETHIKELFPQLTEEQNRLLSPLLEEQNKVRYDQAIHTLRSLVIPYLSLTEAQIKKLFPKVKKLKLPDLTAVNGAALTYLGWIDAGSTKLYYVYERLGKLVGVEARFTMGNKKNICSLCNSYGEVALVTAIVNRKAGQSPDYYKAVGNYMCVDSAHCNERITDTAYLDNFIDEIIG